MLIAVVTGWGEGHVVNIILDLYRPSSRNDYGAAVPTC
jgi:hypothetical protein